MAGSACVTYKSIRRVPRRIAGLTMPAIARPNASSSGVKVVTPLAFCVLLRPATVPCVRRAGILIGHDTLAQKSASTVLRQTFGAYNPGKKCLVSEILFDRSQRLLAGQKHGAHPRRGIVGRKETRLLKFHFQNRVALVKLRRPRKITKRQEKAGQNANRHDPNTFDERMPEPAKIEPVESSAYARSNSHDWFLRIGRNGCPVRRLGRINHGKILAGTLHQQVRSKRRRPKNFPVKKYFRRR